MKDSQGAVQVHQQEQRLTEYMKKLIMQEQDLLGIAITDRDGVPIAQEWSRSAKNLSKSFAKHSQIASAFSNMSDQANKLGIGASDTFIASYQHYQVIQFNELPLHQCVVTLFATADANIGELINSRDLWRTITRHIDKEVLRDSRNPGMI
ncbi:ragulator complex protein LAMTOR3 homolog [Watersipora subatra]|uniref:ragulator complex protein LAMTOR3 homolog n=1 Tax=Watersipora subatra TaxID=2589382 RepID=UPI00355B53D3